MRVTIEERRIDESLVLDILLPFFDCMSEMVYELRTIELIIEYDKHSFINDMKQKKSIVVYTNFRTKIERYILEISHNSLIIQH